MVVGGELLDHQLPGWILWFSTSVMDGSEQLLIKLADTFLLPILIN